MTIVIADNSPRKTYTATAGQTDFPTDFAFFSKSDVNVYVDTVLKTLDSDYSIPTTGPSAWTSGNDGTIVFSTGLVAGQTVVLTRDIEIERTTDFPTSGPFQVASLNVELDKLIAMVADMKDLADRGIHLSDFDTTVGLTLPTLDARKGTILAFNTITGAAEPGPTIADTTSVAQIKADISTVAGISSNVTTVAGISGNVSTVAGINSDVTTVAGINNNVSTVAGVSSNVTSVANSISDVTTVAGISSEVTTVSGISSAVSTVAGKASLITSDFVADLNTLATADIVSDLNTLATSAIVTDMDALANVTAEMDALADITSQITTVSGISANINTVAGISANVTTVAGLGGNVSTVAAIASDVQSVAGDATDIGAVAAIASNVTTVAGNTTNINTVAGVSSNVTTVAGISGNVTTVAGDSSDIQTVAGNTTNINTVAGANSNISTVATNIANVNTTASNITGVNSFAERYRVASSDPTTSLDEGDLAYNTTDNALKYYNGTSWASITAGLTDIVGDGTPQLGGNLDLNSNDITGSGNINISGSATLSGNLTVDTNTLKVDATNNRVGIGTASPEAQLDVSGANPRIRFTDSDASTNAETTGIFEFYRGLSQQGWFGFGASDSTLFSINNIVGGFRIYSNNSEALRIDDSGNVGVGISSPDSLLHISEDTASTSTHSYTKLHIEDASHSAMQFSGSTGGEQWIWFADDTTSTPVGGITYYHGGPYMGFRVEGSERMRIDASGHVGIGTSSALFDVLTVDDTNPKISMRDSGTERAFFEVDSSDNFVINNKSTSAMILETSDTERMRITSGGSVGIGATTVDQMLHLEKSSGTTIVKTEVASGSTVGFEIAKTGSTTQSWRIVDGATANGVLEFYDLTNTATRMAITGAGAVGIGMTNPTEKFTVVNSSSGIVGRFTNNTNQTLDLGVISGSGSAGGVSLNNANSGYLSFQSGGSEAMRIDSSGDVLMGNTVPNPASGFNNQSGFGFDTSAGKVEIASTSGLALSLGRNQASDGHLAEFRKQSNSVGDIQTHSGKLQIGQGNANLQFSNASDAIIPSNGSGTLNDDALDIGLSNARFDDIYATNGTIQTSDRNEKQDIEALSEAEQRVAVAAKGLLRKFRWKDSVEEKGNDARIHFGIIAQDLQAAFEAEGLDAGRYAMFINSTWTDEETGEERSRMGVRYNQLLAFIIAAI
jgi:hypothetical protein